VRRACARGGLIGVVALLAAPGLAQAVPPGVSTGPAVNVTATTAQLRGFVDANGLPTTYFFEYGPTTAYGSATRLDDVGSASGGRAVRANVGSLTPGTTYHYRIVATNSDGTASSLDRSFATRTPFTVRARRLAVGFGEKPVFTGDLAGASSGGRRVGLEARAFPYSGAFTGLGDPTVTGTDGTFTLTAPVPLLSTEYRVTTFDSPPSTSSAIKIGVRIQVGTVVSRTTVARGSSVRFSGTVAPAHAGVPFAVQKRKNGGWVTVAGGLTTRGDAKVSRYSKSVRIGSSGRYRVYVRVSDGDHLPRGGRAVQIRAR
jgi:hypothetical protein